MKKILLTLILIMSIVFVRPAVAKRFQVLESGTESVRWHGLLSVSPGRAFLEMYQANYEYTSFGNTVGTGIEYIYHNRIKMHGVGVYANVYPLGTVLDALFIGGIAGYNLMPEIFLEHNDSHGIWYSEESYAGFFYGFYAGWRFVLGNFIIDLSAGIRGIKHYNYMSYDYDRKADAVELSFWPNVNAGFIF